MRHRPTKDAWDAGGSTSRIRDLSCDDLPVISSSRGPAAPRCAPIFSASAREMNAPVRAKMWSGVFMGLVWLGVKSFSPEPHSRNSNSGNGGPSVVIRLSIGFWVQSNPLHFLFLEEGKWNQAVPRAASLATQPGAAHAKATRWMEWKGMMDGRFRAGNCPLVQARIVLWCNTTRPAITRCRWNGEASRSTAENNFTHPKDRSAAL
jgi:hypothetical protein